MVMEAKSVVITDYEMMVFEVPRMQSEFPSAHHVVAISTSASQSPLLAVIELTTGRSEWSIERGSLQI